MRPARGGPTGLWNRIPHAYGVKPRRRPLPAEEFGASRRMARAAASAPAAARTAPGIGGRTLAFRRAALPEADPLGPARRGFSGKPPLLLRVLSRYGPLAAAFDQIRPPLVQT